MVKTRSQTRKEDEQIQEDLGQDQLHETDQLHKPTKMSDVEDREDVGNLEDLDAAYEDEKIPTVKPIKFAGTAKEDVGHFLRVVRLWELFY